ncbi:MAG: M23 family metallopeptidase [Clostridiales bacterium]|nr:M23 family metallopeptidase [Clostridiales bacterium]
MKRKISIILIISLLMLSGMSFATIIYNPDESVFDWPTASKRVTGVYGTPRSNGRIHSGIDIGALSAGTPGNSIWSVYSGYAAYVGNQGYGRLVMVNSSVNESPFNGYYVQSRYVHLSNYSISQGNYVSQGGNVGKMGDSGTPGQVHLHFEMRLGSQLAMPTSQSSNNPINPLYFYDHSTFVMRSAQTNIFEEGLNERLNQGFSSEMKRTSSKDDGEYGIMKGIVLFPAKWLINASNAELKKVNITRDEVNKLLKTIEINDPMYLKSLHR